MYAPQDPARFKLGTRVSASPMGEVFRATDRQTNETVAIKFLRNEASAEDTARFWREVNVLTSLQHPGIVAYIDHGRWTDSRPYFAMEWLDGEDLDQYAKRNPLGMADSIEVVRRVAQAMAAVHSRGVVHRDLKLSNVFVLNSNLKRGIKLIDFGVVKPAEPDELQTHPGSIIGTPYYMSPEQALGGRVDSRSDVYSIGAMLFRLITGRRVFDADHVIAYMGRLVLEDAPAASSFRPDVPEILDRALAKLLSRDPDHRPANASVVAQWLSHLPACNNLPPGSEQSVSVLRPKQPHNNVDSSSWTVPGTSERRVVGVVLASLPWEAAPPNLVDSLRQILGTEARIQMLQGGQLVAGLGLDATRGDEAVRAARAALKLATTVPDARIAIATGRAESGHQGLAGEALSQAAAQLEHAPPGGIRIGKHTCALLQGRFVVRVDDVGAVLLHEDSSASDKATVLGQHTPTVGRDLEIDLLLSVFRQVATDRAPRAVLVTGASGMGKSRLRLEAVKRLLQAHPHAFVLTSRGDSMQSLQGISALAQAWRARMGVMDGESHQSQIQRVRHYLDSIAHCPEFSTDCLAEFMGLTPATQDTDPGSRDTSALLLPHAKKLQVLHSIEAMLLDYGSRVPCVFVLEDLHLMDDLSLELVDMMLANVELPLVVFALGRRSPTQDPWQLWPNRAVTRVGLAPLSLQACEQIVSLVLPTLPEDRRTRLAKRSGGNALFLEELMRNEVEGQQELPVSVQALIQARLDQLSPDTRHVIRAASVFGQRFWSAAVNELVNRDCEPQIQELTRAELIEPSAPSHIPDQREWSFLQSVVYESAYSSLLHEDRIALHLAAAKWLQSVQYDDYKVIAHHAEQGKDMDAAAVLYTRGAGRAYSNGQALEALEQLDRALACNPTRNTRVQALFLRGQVLSWLGRYNEQLQCAEAGAMSASVGSQAWSECHRLAASAFRVIGQPLKAREQLDEQLRHPGFASLPTTTQARIYADSSCVLLDMGYVANAVQAAQQSSALAQSAGEAGKHTLLRALEVNVLSAIWVLDYHNALTVSSSLVRNATRLGDRLLALRAQVLLGDVLVRRGQFEQAQSYLEQVLQEARSVHLAAAEGMALLHLGQCYARLGDLDQALRLERSAQKIGRDCAHFALHYRGQIREAMYLVWRGAPADLDAALGIVEDCRKPCAHHPSTYVEALIVRAQAFLTRQDLAACLSTCREATRIVDTFGNVQQGEELLRLVYTQALFDGGYNEQALHELERAYRCVLRRSDMQQPHVNPAVSRLFECQRILDMAYAYLGHPSPLGNNLGNALGNTLSNDAYDHANHRAQASGTSAIAATGTTGAIGATRMTSVINRASAPST